MGLLKYILGLVLCFGCLQAEQYPQRYEGRIKAERGDFLSIAERYLPKNPNVLEAGGHYGTDTIRFADLWPEGKILSFEPNPNAFAKLVMATLKYQNVKTFPIALAEYDGEAILHVCYGTNADNPVFEGASSLLDPSEYMAMHYRGPDVVVPCRVLDNWCEENAVDHIDFIWFDLEGMELQVLRSSPKILSTVKVILVETNFQEFRIGMTQYYQLRSFLEASGFTLLCHTYAEGFQGDAIFIKEEKYDKPNNL